MTGLDLLRSRLGDRYVIERELGRGGMGAVYLARDVRLDRLVALKVLPSEYAIMPALRERFRRETHMAASFSHPNIVPVYAIEEADDLVAYVMGYIEGESLAERVKRSGPLSVRETVRLLQDVGYALAYAHGRGVVHRDIKPDNIMIERATGRAQVMDFGVARVIAAPDAARREGLTQVGEIVGTPEYMSPEQATGDRVDGRSDLYSLGLVAYFSLTGATAMSADSTGKALVRQITELLPPMSTVRADLPAPLAAAIDRCVLKDPDARFSSAESLVEALDVAQLAAPEIPLPIRLFAQDAGTLSMVLIGGVVFAYLVARATDPESDGDFLLPVVLMMTVLLTRVMQTLGVARALAESGYSVEAIHRGLAAVVDEREQRRVERRADPKASRGRRRTIAWASGLLVAAVLAFRWALIYRKLVRPETYHIALPGTILVLLSMILLGVSAALLGRSPLRMPIGERLFRLVWVGPLGRAFLRVAGRGIKRGGAQVSGASVVRAKAPGVAAPERIAALEMRVAELERWRKET